MQQYLNEHSTINTIRLRIRHPVDKKYVWVLVEGISDQKLYDKLIDGETTKVEMVYGGGKEKLRQVLELLIKETDQVIGIRDADFLHLNRQKESIKVLFLTDTHDGEMLVLACDTAFEQLIAEYMPAKRTEYSLFRDKILRSLIVITQRN